MTTWHWSNVGRQHQGVCQNGTSSRIACQRSTPSLQYVSNMAMRPMVSNSMVMGQVPTVSRVVERQALATTRRRGHILSRGAQDRMRVFAQQKDGVNSTMAVNSDAEMAMGGMKKKKEEEGRRIVFAVDGTVHSEEGLRWFARNIARKGDVVHLVHVVCDPRTPATAVGSSAAALQWSPMRDEQTFAKEFMSRAVHEAHDMMEERYVPSLEMNGIESKVECLKLKVHKSAGGIAEALTNSALNMGADLLVIASHGAGVYADYGSVARWCNENSPVPTMLLPPAVQTQDPMSSPIKMGATNAVLVGAANDLDGLKRCFEYSLTDHTRPSDAVYVVHLVDDVGLSEDDLVEERKKLVSQVMLWQSQSPCPHANTLNVAVHLVVSNSGCDEQEHAAMSPTESVDELAPDWSPAGTNICDMAAQLNVRTVVLSHHGKNFKREMLYKPITIHCIRQCTSPLVVLDEPHASKNVGY